MIFLKVWSRLEIGKGQGRGLTRLGHEPPTGHLNKAHGPISDSTESDKAVKVFPFSPFIWFI